MTIEQILKILKSNKYIEDVTHEESSGGHFNREISFVVRGVEYKIEWWINLCYLKIGEFTMIFNKLELDGCWPNHFKNNIEFLQYDKVVGILPVEEYESSKQ